MMKSILAAGVAAVALSSAANAASITISTFDLSEFNALTSGPGAVVEDFEGFAGGAVAGPLMTAVGTFTARGGVGSGSTCDALGGGTCPTLAIQDQDTVGAINGQGNLVPFDGTKSLNSNDTLGINWTAMRMDGSIFGKVIFGLRDAADQNRRTFTVSASVGSETITRQVSGNQKLVVIDFGNEGVTSANIQLVTSTNDAFTIDGATIAPVPLPAAGLLLIGGLGALGALRARKKAA